MPAVERVRWSDELAFEESELYGGRLSLRFGPWVELQPYYFTRDDYGIDSATAVERFGPLAMNRSLDMRRFGTNVQFNLGDGDLVPFVRAGAGVLRFIPDSAPRQDRITVSAGGGFRFGLGGLNAELFAEQLSFRMRPQSLFGTDTSTGKPPTLRNLVYGAAITLPLSSARTSDDQTSGLRGTTAPIEPFVGVLRYAGEFDLDDQELAGVRAGIDFSPVFGLRGFYWRGVNDDRDGPADVSGYGGEAQFNLNTGPGISPFLIVGAGQIDYRDEFRDSLGNSRTDQSAFILGGGASIRLNDRIRLNGAIRDYVMSVDPELDNLASTGDLTHNTMLTAGLTIAFGGSASEQRMRTPQRSTTRRDDVLAAEREALAARERALARREAELERDAAARPGARDRTMPMIERAVERDIVVTASGDTVRMRPSGRQWITIPVPERGEIILRYGLPAGTPTVDTVVTGGAVGVPQAAPPAGAPADDVAARLLEIERRMTARLDAMERRLVANPQAGDANPALLVPRDAMPSEPMPTTDDRSATPVFQRFGSTRTRDLRPYLGLDFNDDDTQLVIGVRADLGPINPGSSFHFVPELALGAGGGTSVLAMANVQYAFSSIGGATGVRPYLTFGGGIFTPSVLGVNTAVGSSFALSRDTASPWFLNVELQGINLFDHTRLLFSLSRSR